MLNSGIYKIGNGDNIYIGSTIDFETRKKNHFNRLKRNIHHNKFLQKYYNDNKGYNIHFDILEECEPSELEKREQKYILKYKPKFNISWKAVRPKIKKDNIKIALNDIIQDDNILNIISKDEILKNINEIKNILIELEENCWLQYED